MFCELVDGLKVGYNIESRVVGVDCEICGMNSGGSGNVTEAPVLDKGIKLASEAMIVPDLSLWLRCCSSGRDDVDVLVSSWSS